MLYGKERMVSGGRILPPGPYSKTAKNPVKSRDSRFFDNQIL